MSMSSIEKAIERLNQTKSSPQTGNDEREPDKPSQVETLTENPSDMEVITQEETQPQVLDLSSLSNARYLVPGCTNRTLSEEYRAIKRPVIMNALGKGAAPVEWGNLIGITSSLPGEGKTYTALNLALSMATELNSTILLIDGDILRSSLSNLLGIEKHRGLTDLLLDQAIQVGDVLITTQLPKLKIIAAGTHSENATELLASNAMERLVKELGQRYADRIILFDTPPLLATNEARVLMHLMGQVLMVVEAGKTSLEALKDSLSHISDSKVIGMVLNKTNNRFGRTGYGGYGGYSGGYY
jgi:receptor protein-tyrosine kinase